MSTLQPKPPSTSRSTRSVRTVNKSAITAAVLAEKLKHDLENTQHAANTTGKFNATRSALQAKYALGATAASTQQLAQDTERMNDKLAELKQYMLEQKMKRQTQPRSKWSNTQLIGGSNSYINSMISKIKQQQVDNSQLNSAAAQYYSAANTKSSYVAPNGAAPPKRVATLTTVLPTQPTQPAQHTAAVQPRTEEFKQADTQPSLLDGAVDEEAEHNAFAEARAQFLAALRQPAAPQPAAVQHIDAPAAGQPGSLLYAGDEVDEAVNRVEFEKARLEFLASLQQTAAPAPAAKPATRPSTAHTKTQTAAPQPADRVSCYQCYKLYYSDKGITLEANKQFCCQPCLNAYEATIKVQCSSSQCSSPVLRSQAHIQVDGTMLCDACHRQRQQSDDTLLPTVDTSVVELELAVHALQTAALSDAVDDAADVGTQDELQSPPITAAAIIHQLEAVERAASQPPTRPATALTPLAEALYQHSRPVTAHKQLNDIEAVADSGQAVVNNLPQLRPASARLVRVEQVQQLAQPVVDFPSDDDD